MARPKKKSKSAIQVTQDHGNGSRVMRFRLAVTTPSQVPPPPSQVGDVLASARSQPPVEEPHLSVAAVATAETSALSVAAVATTDASTFSVATARAAAAQPSVTSIPYPLSRSTSPDNEFPNLGDISGDEDEDEVGVPPPMTPRRPGVDRASLYSPTAQSLNPVTPGRTLGRTPGRTPGRTLGRTPGHPRTGQRRTLRRDGPAGNRKRRAAQDVWHFFAENDQRRRECLLCRKRVNDLQSAGDQHQVKTFSLTTGSSNLREHLVDCHRNEWVKSCVDLGLTIKGKDGLAARAAYEVEHSGGYLTNPSSVTSEDCPQFSPEAFVDALVEWIVANDQSINVIESCQLRRLFRMLRPDLKEHDIPHRTTLSTRVTEVHDEYIDELTSQLKKAIGKISLTTDIWSDIQLVAFMAVTAHWIEEQAEDTLDGPRKKLVLRSALIGFHVVPKGHDGKQLAHILFSIVERVQILTKIGWITMDNASNNDTMMVAFGMLLKARGIKFDNFKRHIRCFPHVVNLACKAVLGAITNMDLANEDSDITAVVHDDYAPTNDFGEAMSKDPIAVIRNVVRIIRASGVRRQAFLTLQHTHQQTSLQPLRDCSTRWSSTFFMIERALELQESISSYLLNEPVLQSYHLSDEEWNALEVCKKILSVPHSFQQRLSAEKTPTLCHAIPSFQAMRILWSRQKTEMPHASAVIDEGLEKLAHYEARMSAVPAYILATILNPTMKLHWFEKNMPSQVPRVKQMFLDELRLYKPTESSDFGSPFCGDDDWAANLLGLGSAQLATTSGSERGVEAEFNAYLLDPMMYATPLAYWQENRHRYPTLFTMSADILPIQGSAVPCERVFSSAKETMTARRNHITPALMEALQMLKFSFRGGRSLDFTDWLKADVEKKAMEAILEVKNHPASKPLDFLQSFEGNGEDEWS